MVRMAGNRGRTLMMSEQSCGILYSRIRSLARIREDQRISERTVTVESQGNTIRCDEM